MAAPTSSTTLACEHMASGKVCADCISASIMAPVYAREARLPNTTYRAAPDDTIRHPQHEGRRPTDLWACRECIGGLV